MPCDCSGYPVQYTAFGKQFTGRSGGMSGSGLRTPPEMPWKDMVEEGERALCKAQDLIADIYLVSCWGGLALSPQMKTRVQEQLKMLAEHKEREGANASKLRLILREIEEDITRTDETLPPMPPGA